MTSEYEIAFALVRGMSVDLARKILDVVESEQNFFSRRPFGCISGLPQFLQALAPGMLGWR